MRESDGFGCRSEREWLDSRGAYELPRWSLVGGTTTVREAEGKKKSAANEQSGNGNRSRRFQETHVLAFEGNIAV